MIDINLAGCFISTGFMEAFPRSQQNSKQNQQLAADFIQVSFFRDLRACLFDFFFFFPGFSKGLVQLYIAGLPLRSCQTIEAPSVQGSAQYAFFFRFWQQQDSNSRPGS